MEPLKQAQNLLEFLKQNRKSGTTSLLVDTYDNNDSYFIVNDEHQKAMLKTKSTKDDILPLKHLDFTKFAGKSKKPILIDNYPIIELLEKLIYLNKELKIKLNSAQNALTAIQEIIQLHDKSKYE